VAEDKVHGREILQTFFARAGSGDAHIAIIPSASREPAIIGSRYLQIFEDMGAKQVDLLDIREQDSVKTLHPGEPRSVYWVFDRWGSTTALCRIG